MVLVHPGEHHTEANMPKKRTVIQVSPNRSDGGWNVMRKGARKPLSSHKTKAIAVKRGRRVAKKAAPGQIKIYTVKGKVQASHNYD